MKTVAIVGATGLAGEKLTALVANMPNVRVRLFGENSVGRKICVRNKSVVVESCENLLCPPPDYALFMSPNDVSAKYVPKAAKKGVVCIDNSSFFRLKKGVPLVVPCINGDEARGSTLIANPNCSTIQVAIALNALKQLCPTRLLAVTYQSASGAGREGLNDLTEQRGYGKLKSFRHPIYDNLIPMIGEVTRDGYTEEEQKLKNESRKILGLPRLKVNSFCVRVPVSVCHGAFVNVAFKNKFTLDKVRALLGNAPDVLLLDEPKCGLYPMPLQLRNTKYVGVGRITKDTTANAINFFCVADNLLRGAAYNAYEILLCKMREEKCL